MKLESFYWLLLWLLLLLLSTHRSHINSVSVVWRMQTVFRGFLLTELGKAFFYMLVSNFRLSFPVDGCRVFIVQIDLTCACLRVRLQHQTRLGPPPPRLHSANLVSPGLSLECGRSWLFGVSGKPILDLTSDLNDSSAFFSVCSSTSLWSVNYSTYWKSTTFFFLDHFTSHDLNQTDSLLLLSCWVTCMAAASASRPAGRPTFHSVVPVVSLLEKNACYDARPVCILYQFLLLDVFTAEIWILRYGTSGN